jgi:ABC-type branched-subunit amino acid transport system ATPase component
MSPGFKITEMFAFIATEKDGTEGVMGMMSENGWVPLVGADMDRVESIKPIVQGIAQSSGVNITLAKFSVRENLEVIS